MPATHRPWARWETWAKPFIPIPYRSPKALPYNRVAVPLHLRGAPAEEARSILRVRTRKRSPHEIALLNHFVQVFVCGGYESEIAFNFPCQRQGGESDVPEELSKSFLESSRQFAYLIEKKRAALGLFTRPSRAFSAPVKAPFSCPKRILSTRVWGNDAQSTTTKLLFDRLLLCELPRQKAPFLCRSHR